MKPPGDFIPTMYFLPPILNSGVELEWLFEYLQCRKQPAEYMKIPFKHLLVSQFNMIKRFQKLIDREIKNAKKGRPAGIIIKLNNLQERDMIEDL